jgi:penicillin-binding protein 2
MARKARKPFRSKPREKERFTRRAVLLGAAQAAGFGLLGARLYGLQITDGAAYRLLAEDNRINLRAIVPLRGRIYDRFGRLLASNRDNLQLIVVPEEAGDLKAVLADLARYVPLTGRDKARILRTARRQRGFVPIMVREDVPWARFARVNVLGPDLPGVRPQVGARRQYHQDPWMAHVLGYVGFPTEDEAFDDPVNRLPGFRIGKSGIERAFELKLRGRPGARKVEVNAGGRVIRELGRQPAQTGAELVTTVDLDLQKFAMQRLEGESGAAVAIDIHNGDILALASVPGFDTNQFVNSIKPEIWRALNAHPRKPLHNKALRGQYPPGSVFKMAVALAGLEFGVIEPKERLACHGGYQLGSHTFHCWRRRGHGRVALHYGIKQSCDIYFYQVAQRLGVDRIADMARRLGLGPEKPHLPGAKPGVMPTAAWKRAVIGEKWYGGDTLVAGIGQGYVQTSPLELAVMTARIANGALAIEPRLVRAMGGVELPVKKFKPLGVSKSALDLVCKGMAAVTNEPGGTGFRSRIDVDGQKMAGKTGTSQVVRLSAIRRRGKAIPWAQRDHALFIAYAPVENPRYAVCVVVEHGGGGSRAAAPVAKDIMLQLLAREPARAQAFRSGGTQLSSAREQQP